MLLAMSRKYFSAASATAFSTSKLALLRFDLAPSNRYTIDKSRSSTLADSASLTEPSEIPSDMLLAPAECLSMILRCTLNRTLSDDCSTRSASWKQTSYCQQSCVHAKKVKVHRSDCTDSMYFASMNKRVELVESGVSGGIILISKIFAKSYWPSLYHARSHGTIN